MARADRLCIGGRPVNAAITVENEPQSEADLCCRSGCFAAIYRANQTARSSKRADPVSDAWSNRPFQRRPVCRAKLFTGIPQKPEELAFNMAFTALAGLTVLLTDFKK